MEKKGTPNVNSAYRIAEMMEEDHDRLDKLFEDFQESKKVEPLSEFIKGLKRHIVIEEEILFPLFEKRSGINHGPTQVMRVEHRMIKELLTIMHDKFAEKSSDLQDVIRKLTELMKSHNEKEEQVLYPWIDQELSEADKEQTITRIKELPPGIEGSCCS